MVNCFTLFTFLILSTPAIMTLPTLQGTSSKVSSKVTETSKRQTREQVSGYLQQISTPSSSLAPEMATATFSQMAAPKKSRISFHKVPNSPQAVALQQMGQLTVVAAKESLAHPLETEIRGEGQAAYEALERLKRGVSKPWDCRFQRDGEIIPELEEDLYRRSVYR
jgi:hypothetical protein